MSQLYTYEETRPPEVITGCGYCLSPEETPDLVCFRDLWTVRLHPKQAHLGTIIACTMRHAPKVSELTHEELADFQFVMSNLEHALREAFGTALLNYACSMNYAFRSEDPNPPFEDGKPSPHVRWQIYPRYPKPVAFAGVRFEDPTFGAPNITGRDMAIGGGVRKAIRQRMIERLDVKRL